ncbi:MAG: hypothetical protein VW405_00545 [Rhodospirillaceae bacterium]
MSAVAEALDLILGQQEPFPAVVVDRRWNLLRANAGAVRLVEFLVGPLEAGAAVNLADALVGPDVLKPFVVNWPDVVRYFIASVEADAWADGTRETAALLERLAAYPDVDDALQGAPAAGVEPVLPMHFRKDGTELRLFTTLATLGTPQNVTVQELRIECFFPMDAASAEVLRGWAAAS